MIKLNKKEIQSAVSGLPIEIELFDVIDSTNKYLSLQNLGDTVRVCLAEQQTSGKGQLDKTWHSPYGENIYCSCSFLFNKSMAQLSGLSLVVSLAIIKTLLEFGVAGLHVKWPNDVLFRQKKLAGAVIELKQNGNDCHAIIGIGINVNMTHNDDHAIDQSWTSIKEINEQDSDRNKIISTLLNSLATYLDRFSLDGFDPFIDEWAKHDFFKDKDITLQSRRERIEGKVLGVDVEGKLLLRLNDGQVKTFSSGEASISKA